VSRAEVDEWIGEVKAFGVRSIICLLAHDQLKWYADVPEGLISYYRAVGFTVAHVPG